MISPTLCGGHSPLDVGSACVRETWAAAVPAALAAFFCICAIPGLGKIWNATARALKLTTYLSLAEAEGIQYDDAEIDAKVTRSWRPTALTCLALVAALAWVSVAIYQPYMYGGGAHRDAVLAALVAFSWLYSAFDPLVRRQPTPYYTLFTLQVAQFACAVCLLGGIAFDRSIHSIPVSFSFLAVQLLNLAVVLALLVISFTTPVGISTLKPNPERDTCAEDTTALWKWMTFAWIIPLLVKGNRQTLKESEVPAISPTMRVRPMFRKYIAIRSNTRSLFASLWQAAALDTVLNVILTLTGVVLTYGGPFFLNRILQTLEDEDRSAESRARGLLYALLAFVFRMCNAEVELQRLWYARRGAIRIRGVLMAAIYEKALKRKDFSGVVDKADADNKNGKGDDKCKGKGKDRKKSEKEDSSKGGAEIGKTVTLMSSDVGKLASMLLDVDVIFSTPVEIFFASFFLYKLLGWSAFAGFTAIVLSWPINRYLVNKRVVLIKGLQAARDKRTKTLNEFFSAIKFIKFFAWEERWINRAREVREVEMSWLIDSRRNMVFIHLLWSTVPVLNSASAFAVYVFTGHELTIAKAFTAISLFSLLRPPMNTLPLYFVQVMEAKVSYERVVDYLSEDEVDEQVSTLKRQAKAPGAEEVKTKFGIEQGTFKWNVLEDKKDKKKGTVTQSEPDGPEENHFELRDIDVVFPNGKLSIVAGNVASGKTALLMALLGEMTTLSGRILLSKDPLHTDENGFVHAVSYAAQTPWLIHQSIKANILFGYPYDEERYRQVIECCTLQPDLDIFDDGDETEIGARGVVLSGGQKARVALARAVYAPTKWLLLDDPLSAVDSHTARNLTEKLLKGPLLAKRTVVLVTHHVELALSAAHYFVRMADGRIELQGEIEELKTQSLLDCDSETPEDTEGAKTPSEDAVAEEQPEVKQIEAQATADVGDPFKKKAKRAKELVKAEHRETGRMKMQTYATYLKAAGVITWVLISFFTIGNQLMTVGERLWIKVWGEAYGRTPELWATTMIRSYNAQGVMRIHQGGLNTAMFAVLPSAQRHPLFYVGIYAGIGMTGVALFIVGIIILFYGATNASRELFMQLVQSVSGATMRWFDTIPMGRILNRFGDDMNTVDTGLAGNLQVFISSVSSLLASLLTVTVVFPPFVVPAIAIGYVYVRLTQFYVNSARDLRRMMSNARSPIYAAFGELLEGVITVRGFGAEERLLNGHCDKVDSLNQMWYSYLMTMRWLLFNFSALGGFVILIAMLFTLFGGVSAGIAGLTISSAMSATSYASRASRKWTDLEVNLNAVERVEEYLRLPQDHPPIIEGNRPPAYWPSSSTTKPLVEVDKLVVKYAPDLPSILKGVSFTLKPRERVGILGRTGSGKSTLAMSLLRFTEFTEGRIVIDGIDISKIGLRDLRSRLTFIPQDCTLFSGTIRANIDPAEEHTEEECIDVLYRVQLINRPDSSRAQSETASIASAIVEVPSDDGKTKSVATSTTAIEPDTKRTITLDTQVSPGGNNFSQGQRQLIAMARALLRQSSIILLDEATSSIDFATDAKIQAIIREEFGNSLLITIAHRLRTIIDYDRLIILEQGEVAEMGTPWELLQREDSIFRSMCLKSDTFDELESVARESTNSQSA